MYGRIDLDHDKDLSRLLNILDDTPSKNIFIILAGLMRTPLRLIVLSACIGQNSLASIGQGMVRSPISRWSLQILRQHILTRTNPTLLEIGKTATSSKPFNFYHLYR
jgi:hypothetical protein